jgi:glycosyltransferase involved in cell wall biosynthesis
MRKINILFCTLHRPDRSPSQRFRFEQYISYLGANGFECEHLFMLGETADKQFYSPGSYFGKLRILARSVARLVKASRRKDHDIVFVQREAFMLGTTFFERRFGKNAKLVFDFDDSIWLQNVSEGNRRLAFLKNPEKTAELAKMASLVLAGNEYLADYARKLNPNVAIVPTTIDTDEYARVERSENDAVCIGWSGSKTTIQHFEYAIPALTILKKKYGNKISIRVIGESGYRNEELGITGLPWKKETEIADLSAIDIGIMPLPDDEWSRGKCGLKGLQYMALEIPAVMSPVGVNTEIIRDGVNGMLASSTEEWVEKLSWLIDNAQMRREIGKAGRETVVKDYSVAAWRDEYVKLLRSLI